MAVLYQPKRYKLKPVVGTQINYGNPITAGITAVWLLAEGGGSFEVDSLGRKHLTAQFAGISWIPGPTGMTITPSSNGYIGNTSYTTADVFTASTHTVLASALATSFTTAANTFSMPAVFADTSGYVELAAGTNGSSGFWVGLYDGSDKGVVATCNVNEWHQIAGVHTGGTLYAYKDGIQVGSIAAANIANTAGNLRVLGSFGGVAFTGNVEYVFLWNRALSAAEVSSLFMDPYQIFLPQAQHRYWKAATVIVAGDPPFSTIFQPTFDSFPNVVSV